MDRRAGLLYAYTYGTRMAGGKDKYFKNHGLTFALKAVK